MTAVKLCTKRARTRRRDGGFSYVELVIVVLILGIMTVAAAPRMGDALQYHRVDSAADRIAFDLQLARNRARMASAAHDVTFDSAGGSYTLTGVPDLDHPGQDYSVDLSATPYHVLLTNVDFGGDQIVSFNGFGIPDSGGQAELAAGSYTRTVVLDASGRVTVQ